MDVPESTRIGRREFLAQSAAGAALVAGAQTAAGAPFPAETLSKEAHTGMRFREKLLQCLGGPWPNPCELRPKPRETIVRDGYRIESLTYEAEPGDSIPAMLLIPDGVDANNPAPAVAVWHQHNGEYHLGKSEPAGLAGNPMHHTGAALARLGYVVLCPDALCFEQRRGEHLRGDQFERFEFLRYVVAGKCMAWKNILDMRRAVDYLCARPEVLSERIGCYGHSMGSTHTWLVGPWEPRLKCLVGNCCLPTYAAIHRTQILHCFPNFIPGLFAFGDTPDLAALIAPRPLLLNFGELDGGSPIQEVRQGIETIARAYQTAGAEEMFSHYIEDGVGHVLSESMWDRTREWFARHLRG
ncbi:MAG: dienelactone hydrolase family protein [Pirellulales bacterium]|nr:dienelactone hydrolase family protein [Pirellulales bacterium]